MATLDGFESPGSTGGDGPIMGASTRSRASSISAASSHRSVQSLSPLGSTAGPPRAPSTTTATSTRQSSTRARSNSGDPTGIGTAAGATLEERAMHLRMTELLQQHRGGHSGRGTSCCGTSQQAHSVSSVVGKHFDPSKPFNSQLRDLSPRVQLKTKEQIRQEIVANRQKVLRDKKEEQRKKIERERLFHRTAKQQEQYLQHEHDHRMHLVADHIASVGVPRDSLSVIQQSSPGASAQASGIVIQQQQQDQRSQRNQDSSMTSSTKVVRLTTPMRGENIGMSGAQAGTSKLVSPAHHGLPSYPKDVAQKAKEDVEAVHGKHLLRRSEVDAYFAVPAFLKPLIGRQSEALNDGSIAPPMMLPSEQNSRSASVETSRMKSWERASEVEFRRAQEMAAHGRRR